MTIIPRHPLLALLARSWLDVSHPVFHRTHEERNLHAPSFYLRMTPLPTPPSTGAANFLRPLPWRLSFNLRLSIGGSIEALAASDHPRYLGKPHMFHTALPAPRTLQDPQAQGAVVKFRFELAFLAHFPLINLTEDPHVRSAVVKIRFDLVFWVHFSPFTVF